jgi:Integrase core domain
VGQRRSFIKLLSLPFFADTRSVGRSQDRSNQGNTDEVSSRWLIRVRAWGEPAAVARRLRAMGIRDKPIAPGSPWQNGFAERLIGSIRRECVDHIVVLGEAHLRRILTKYAAYYNELRTDRSLGKDAPVHRAIQHVGRIAAMPCLSSADFIIIIAESNFWYRHRKAGFAFMNAKGGIWDRSCGSLQNPARIRAIGAAQNVKVIKRTPRSWASSS